MCILIIDNDAVSLKALHHSLTTGGYEVEIARDGEEALEILRAGDCRRVISAWHMAGMDGLELCRRVRHEKLPAYVYFILLISREGDHNIVEGLTAGADEFLIKPFDPPELLARVRAAERILALETRDVTIFAMAKLAESRDPETGAHLERVREYARLLAQEMMSWNKDKDEKDKELDADFVHLIYLTSPLHDIGKVGIPDSVLLKPGAFTKREYEVMKTHTTIGAKTLNAVVSQFPKMRFLEMARDIALTHHECFDGQGYPSGLRGNDIPICGRIVALADVYDAITSKRVYKEAMDHDFAKKTIIHERGHHFAPNVVDAFMRMEDKFITVHDRVHQRELAMA